MSKSKTSRRWLDRHFRDPYVQRAQQLGYRSRAAFKLLELQEKDQLLTPGARVIDLGAAPGGWSQVASDFVGSKGLVIAVDLIEMADIPGVIIRRGDFLEDAMLDELVSVVGDLPMDIVLSDMAPNISGIAAVDQPRSILLGELVLDFATKVLKHGGAAVVKTFQGEGFDGLRAELRRAFSSVVVRKPLASRADSRECYMVAKGFR